MSAIKPLRDELEPSPGTYLTLPSRYYTDRRVFEAEKEAIFARAWQFACHVSELDEPGRFITVDLIDDQLVFINDNGEIRGFHNVCRHRAHRLLEGRGKTDEIVCPYHAWRYGSDGKLEHARNSERMPDFDKCAYSLVPVKVERFVDFVMYNLDLDAPPFDSQVPGLADEIRAAAPWLGELIVDNSAAGFTSGVPMACNWKVLVDNCVECYHCTASHPDFTDLVAMNGYRVELHERHTTHTAMCEKTDNRAYWVSADERDRRFFFWHVWPNMTFGIFPGTPNFGVFSATPIDFQTTDPRGVRLRCAGPENERDRRRREYVDNTLWPEDLSICESVQRGLRSRSYDQGTLIAQPPHGGHDEGVCRLFQHLTREALRGYV